MFLFQFYRFTPGTRYWYIYYRPSFRLVELHIIFVSPTSVWDDLRYNKIKSAYLDNNILQFLCGKTAISRFFFYATPCSSQSRMFEKSSKWIHTHKYNFRETFRTVLKIVQKFFCFLPNKLLLADTRVYRIVTVYLCFIRST